MQQSAVQTQYNKTHLDEACRMVDAFASVGCRSFDLTQTTVDGECVSYRPGRNLLAMKTTLLPYLLPRVWILSQNLIIRPRQALPDVLAQLDDLDARKLDLVRSRAFLMVETSPGNYQAWIDIIGGNDDLVRRLVAGMRVDWNASRAVRLAGTPNCKRRYEPMFPVVAIVDVQPGAKVVAPRELDDLAIPPVEPPARRSRMCERPVPHGWPDYQQVLRGAPARKRDGLPDRSCADYFWSKWSLERGHEPVNVQIQLLEVSEKAREEWDRGNHAYVSRIVAAAMEAK